MKGAEKLVYMANQITAFFRTQPHDDAVVGIAEHLKKFWNPVMLRDMDAHIAKGGEGLDPLALEAFQKLRKAA
ncbi:formate dehydrogenase subunit delta [Methylovirgula sp. 4M-Z18]|uniref:formate dehydrogenase subunit delta n=1 Tax=Methylovirgula sp. 4M-Z18 TaxID=2293567 RepID=UPI000E2F1AD3|nr:formate dehydrogenase subunit delta [Methylovirgula sp. 4M-Z18]RFB79643.1 formate dehydrogenase [Methylovirgula sp. 4M-Z18]